MNYTMKQTATQHMIIEISSNAIIDAVYSSQGYQAIDALYIKLQRINRR